MSAQRFYLIGLSDDRSPRFLPEVTDVIARGRVFSGGKRHREVVASLLPPDAAWIDITVPLDRVFALYEGHPEVVVFVSGDPLFSGFAATIKRKLPAAEISLFPSFHSLQILAHRMLLPYEEMCVVPLTGRPWNAFDAALIRGERLVGVLTDRGKTPSAIAARMSEYGYDNYRMTVGEALGNREAETVRTFTPEEAAQHCFRSPNCLILERTAVRPRPFGIPDSEFHLLNGRSKMITKMPVRLLVLSMLGLPNRHFLWDIGFCTGSVSIEAKLQAPELDVTAFEQRPEGRELMEQNSRRFGTPGITTRIEDFLETDTSRLPRPDAVFIGGHGGRLVEILQKIHSVLQPGGVIVFNSVSEESRGLFEQGVLHIGRRITRHVRLVVDAFHPIEIMRAE